MAHDFVLVPSLTNRRQRRFRRSACRTLVSVVLLRNPHARCGRDLPESSPAGSRTGTCILASNDGCPRAVLRNAEIPNPDRDVLDALCRRRALQFGITL